MFTGGAILLIVVVAWFASRANKMDRSKYDAGAYEDRVWTLALHVRQDLKLVVFLLAGITVMLGVIADRLP